MVNRTCEQCEGPMPLMARSHAVTCSPRCRKARSRKRRALPSELTSRPRWVRHTARKVPLTVAGRVASSTDPTSWSTYREAAASKAGAGAGFVLNGDGLVCVDLDHALDEQGQVLPWAQPILERTPGCWVEVSVSGRGLHVWGYGRLERGRRLVVDGGTVEVYPDGRFIAVTGRTFGSSPKRLGDLSTLLASLPL